MSMFLINTCETYRVDMEAEAKQLIEEAKNDPSFTLMKYSSEYKEKVAKGEVVDSYFKVTLSKGFNSIKEPETVVEVNYTKKEY